MKQQSSLIAILDIISLVGTSCSAILALYSLRIITLSHIIFILCALVSFVWSTIFICSILSYVSKYGHS